MWYLPMGGYLRAVKIVFGIIAALSVLAVISDVMEIRLYGKVIAGDEVSDQQVDFNDIRVAVVAIFQWFALIGGAITFILWLYRAYQNTDAVAPGTRRYGRGWAIGGWFVPVLAWWRPKQVINDICLTSSPSSVCGKHLSKWDAETLRTLDVRLVDPAGEPPQAGIMLRCPALNTQAAHLAQ